MTMLTRRRWITIFSVLGIGVAGYLTYIHVADVPIFCGGANSCELVNNSRYAFIGSIPVAALGLAAYLTLAVLSLIPVNEDRTWPDQLIFGLSLIGVIFTAYLTYIELFVLYAICWWCASSAVLIVLIFILSIPRSSHTAEESVDHAMEPERRL